MALSDFTTEEFCLDTYSTCFGAAFLFQWLVILNTLYISSGNLALNVDDLRTRHFLIICTNVRCVIPYFNGNTEL